MHIVRLVTLTVAGLTGPPSVFILPFFIIEYIITRHTERLHELIALGLASAIQAVLILSQSVREITTYWDVLPFALLVKQWILPFLGPTATSEVAGLISFYNLFNYHFLALFALLPFVLFLVILALLGRREALLLFCCSWLVATLSFVGSSESRSPELILAHATCWGASRYYFAPNVLLGFSLLASSRADLWRPRWTIAYRWTRLVLVTAMLIVGSANFIPTGKISRFYFTGPTWTSQVEAWAEGRQDGLAIWPKSWTIELPKPTKDK